MIVVTVLFAVTTTLVMGGLTTKERLGLQFPINMVRLGYSLNIVTTVRDNSNIT